jgi:LysM repeat protein
MWGCTSNLVSLRGNQDHVIEELRTEIADVRHAVHGTEVEIKLLEEKLENQDAIKDDASMQRKIASLEKTIEKMNGDLKSLMAYATQTTSSLTQYRDHILEIDRKLEEVTKLRSTLSQISKNHTAQEAKRHRVKSGDSLEKIARLYSTSPEALKKENSLSSDRIIVGQELKIPE